MKKYQIYASLLLFSFLMGVRLFMPKLAENIRSRAFEAVDVEQKYNAFIEVLGDKLNDDGLRDELIAVLGLNLAQENERDNVSDRSALVEDREIKDTKASSNSELSS